MKEVPVHASRSALALCAALVLLSGAAGAQMRVASVPAGICQVWIEGQPASRQPAPTDCATARARAALLPHARVIYGANTNRGVNQSTDPRNRTGYDPRYDSRYDRTSRKLEKERAKAERKQQKAWEKAHERDAGDRDRERNRDRDRDRDDRHDRGR
jgi:hypothetical protein